MLRDLAAHPWRAGGHARTLADLHRRLHALAAGDDLRPTFGRTGPDDVLVHGDLHPDNVLLSPAGPVVIDWANAGRGPAGADVADCWLLLASAEAPVGPVMRAVVAVLRRRFLAVFLRHAGRVEAARHLETALRRRLADTNISAEERARMRGVVARHGRG